MRRARCPERRDMRHINFCNCSCFRSFSRDPGNESKHRRNKFAVNVIVSKISQNPVLLLAWRIHATNVARMRMMIA